ncbi:hypothetical protein [Cytobacillus oceanisediminis]|uniref:hypothetical protein n=1 Tax=Cytobacillus oceanisediminis TaxID=665099 RepID=UPI003734D85F
MKSKLEVLTDDERFGTEAIDCETGIMINKYNDVVTYLFMEYEGYFEVYLSIQDDENEAPYRDILAEGIAATLEEAKSIAFKNLNEMAYSNIN